MANKDEKEHGLYHMGGQNIRSDYNGGGERVDLVTVSGNIYLREK